MSTLTSSAVGGRKAPPRAPPRRRAAPKSSAQTASHSHDLSPTTTDHNESQIEQSTTIGATSTGNVIADGQRLSPSPPVVVERPVAGSSRGASDTQSNIPIRDSAPNVTTLVTAPNNGLVPSAPVQTSQESRKRPREIAQQSGSSPSKRVRISRASQSDQPNAARERIMPSSASATTGADSLVQGSQLQEQSQTEPPRTSIRRRVATSKAKDGPTTARKRVQQPSENVDPSITSDQFAQLSADQVANALADQLNSGSQKRAAKPRVRRQRRSKPARASNSAGGDGDNGADTASDLENDSDENHEIDPSTLSMFDLSHDSRHGKTSEREKKMAKIDWADVARKRREEADAIMKGEVQPDKEGLNVVTSTEGGDDLAQLQGEDDDQDGDGEGAGSASTGPEPVTRPSGGGVRFRIVGGQLVEDEASLTIDRAARVVQAAADTADAIEEENDLTTRFNRTTYINARKRDPTERVPLWRSKSDAWTDEDTDRFYDALRMFGTDFFIISKMFPPRTRKQIKLKFVREERLEPDRVNAALLGRHTRHIDLDHYAQAINRDVNDFHKYDGLEHANEVIRASMKDKEEAMRAAVKEDEENNRQREAQRQQREKQRSEADKKKEERAKKKAMSRRGDVWGAGTLGGADDDHDEFDNA